jgi:hypothetical protein
LYESYDGGKTWEDPKGADTFPGMLVSLLQWSHRGSLLLGPPTRDVLSTLVFTDGTPLVERIGGVPTRHLMTPLPAEGDVPDPGFLGDFPDRGPLTLHLWVSTDITPTIRQVRIAGAPQTPEQRIGPALAVAFSPDSGSLAVGHGTNNISTVRVWNLRQPESIPRAYAQPGTGFVAVAFPPAGYQIVAADVAGGLGFCSFSEDRHYSLWSPNSMVDQGSAAALRPDGAFVVAAVPGGLYLANTEEQEGQMLAAAAGRDYRGVALSPDNRTLAASAADGVWLFNLDTPAAPPRLLPHPGARAVAFSADGRRLAAIRDNTAGAAGALVRIWDVSQADPMPMDLPGTASSGAAVAFSPDGRFLAASGPEDTLDLWRLEPPGAAPVRLPAGQPINGVAFSPDGQRLAAATADGAVRLWDMGILQDPAQAPAAAPTVLVEQPSSTNPTIRSFTWRWSRFNEDFGVVEAPPTETIDP